MDHLLNRLATGKEGRPTCEASIEDRSQRPDVGSRANGRVASCLLRGHVAGRAQDGARPCLVRPGVMMVQRTRALLKGSPGVVPQVSGKTEVGDLREEGFRPL